MTGWMSELKGPLGPVQSSSIIVLVENWDPGREEIAEGHAKPLLGPGREPGFIQWYFQGISKPNFLCHCLGMPTHEISFFLFLN